MIISILILSFELTLIISSTVLAIPSRPYPEPPSLLFNATIPAQNRAIHCLDLPRLFPFPVHADCVSAVDRILRSPDLMRSKTWSVTGTQTQAASWVEGTCTIEIGVYKGPIPPMNAEGTDTFSIFSFVGQAQGIVLECVAGGWKFGGYSLIGPKRIFKVLVRHTTFTPGKEMVTMA